MAREPRSPGLPVGGLIAVAAILSSLFAVKIKSWDVWWHLATGRWIAEHHRLPRVDPFTYTMRGEPWRLVNGLAATVLYGFHAALGPAGLVLAKVVFGAATVGLVGAAARATSRRPGVVVAVMMAAALLLQARYSMARPLVMGATLVAAGTWATLRLEEGRRAPLWFFGLALPLWPLVHGTALVGLAQLVLGLVALSLARRRGETSRRALRDAVATFAVLIVVVTASFWWRELFAVAFGLGRGVTATSFTGEWRSGVEASGDNLGRWLFMVVGLLGGIRQMRRRLAPAALAALGLVLAARFGRNAFEGVILATPGLAAGLDAGGERLQRVGARLAARVAPIAVVIFAALLQIATAPRRTINRPFGRGVAEGRYPDDTLRTLTELPEGRLINGFPLGGYLIWKEIPGGVYSDGRTVALYREKDVERLFAPLIESDRALTAAADRWSAVYGLAQNGSLPQQWMMVSPEWVPLHLGAGTVLFARRTVVDRLPDHVRPLLLLRHTSDARWTEGWYRGILANPDLFAQLLEEMAAQGRRGRDSPLIPAILNVVDRLDPTRAAELAAAFERGAVSPR